MKNAFAFKTLAEFLEHFKDEQTCHEHFTAIRFRNGEYCPHCGHTKIYTFGNGKRYRCAKCKQDFRIQTGTVFGESKLPLKKWFIAIYLLSTSNKGISSVQLAKQVGVTQKTGWFMDHRIRSAMKQNKGQLFGTVECDETYVGGKEKNKHKNKKMKTAVGRSVQTKTPVFGIRSREGEVRATAIPNCKEKLIMGIIQTNVAKGTTVHTDEMLSYRNLPLVGFSHFTIRHGLREYARGECHTNSIESFWALFKRGYHGIYHWMSPKHMQRYVDESVFRVNRREEPMNSIFAELVANMAKGNKLPYKELIA
jgi:transposase-like protein